MTAADLPPSPAGGPQISVRVPDSVYLAVQRLARRKGWNRNQAFVWLVQQGLMRQENKQ